MLSERALPRRALVIALTPLVDPRFEPALCGLADRGQDIVMPARETNGLGEKAQRLERREGTRPPETETPAARVAQAHIEIDPAHRESGPARTPRP